MQRRGTWAASTGQERNPPTLLSFPAKALLLDATHRHNKLDNKIMRTLRVTFITRQPLDVHNCEAGPTFLATTGPFTQNSSSLSRCLFMNQTCCDVKTKTDSDGENLCRV